MPCTKPATIFARERQLGRGAVLQLDIKLCFLIGEIHNAVTTKKCEKYFLLTLFLGLCACSGVKVAAQDNQPSIHIQVNMVQLNVAVTDSKGNYITGLRPQDFEVTEDNIPEKLAVFAEGHESVPCL